MSTPTVVERDYEPDWPDPVPLLTPRDEPKPYPLNAFPPAAAHAIAHYQAYGQQPVAMIGGAALANISLAAQGLVDVARDTSLVGPISLNITTIAESGERKTAADRAFSHAAREWQKRREDEMEPEIIEARSKVEAHKAEREGILGKLKRDAKPEEINSLKSRLIDLDQNQPSMPTVPQIFFEDSTPEALALDIGKGWPSASLWSDEGGLVYGGRGMGDDSIMRYLGLLNRLWDGNDFKRRRTTAESFTISGRRMTCSLMMQNVVLARLMRDDISRGTGYLARGLLACPTSTKGTRLYREADMGATVMHNFHNRITALLDLPLPVDGDEMRLAPTVISLSEAAKRAWVGYHDDVERELAKFGEFGDVGDFASKSAENAARIAGCLHVFEHGPTGSISEEMIGRGTALAYWHLCEARRIIGGTSAPEDVADAVLLWEWIMHRGEREVSPRLIQQYGPNQLRDRKRRNRAIDLLVENSYGVMFTAGKADILRVNPKARSDG